MLKDKVFQRRFIKLSIILNAPALITPLLVYVDLEPILLIALFGLWLHVPLLLGLGNLFDSSNVVYGEFGAMDASAIVLFFIFIFWVTFAAILSSISIKFSNRKNA